ncbi:MAG: GOLPH3/VPS74 family protein [Acidimicrobiales bacterium]
MLLAEELALVSIKPETGRHALGMGDQLNACLAGLLVAELLMEGLAQPGEDGDTVVLAGQPAPASATLAAAAKVVSEKGPKIKAVLSHMDRGLHQEVGMGIWNAVMSGLVEGGVVGPSSGSLLPHHELVDPAARDQVVSRLRAAAAGDDPIDPRTALVLSMTGPAYLLGVVAPDRHSRGHARQRIDHALDDSNLAPVVEAVRRLISEAAAAAAITASTGTIAGA